MTSSNPVDALSVDRNGRPWRGRLRVTRCVLAGSVVPGLDPRHFTHAGPPVSPDDLAPGLVGALRAGLALEGESVDVKTVRALVATGELRLSPGHELSAIGPLAGVITPRTPVWVVEAECGELAVSPVHEGAGNAMRSGQFSEAVVSRLVWLGESFAPIVNEALSALGGLDGMSVLASGLNRGDEAHNRNVANSLELLRSLAPPISRSSRNSLAAAAVIEELASNLQSFLPVGMATAKLMVDEVYSHGPVGLVTAAGANGREFGLRVSGLSGWTTCPSAVQAIGSTFAGRAPTEASPLIGDSLVMELIGLGVAALTAAPKLANSLGASPAEANDLVRRAATASRARSGQFKNPNDEFRGTPSGIDVFSVAREGVAPTFTVGYLGQEPGAGRVGAGFFRPEVDIFARAARELQFVSQRGKGEPA